MLIDPIASYLTTVTERTYANVADATASTSTETLFKVQGYSSAGDGGDCHFIKNLDGVARFADIVRASGRYQILDSDLDPRMGGAKFDYMAVANGRITVGQNRVTVTSPGTNWAGWTIADVGKVFGMSGVGAATPAYGDFRVTKKPSAGQTFTIGATTVTWVAGAPGAGQIQIPATKTLTAAAMATYINTNTVAMGVTASSYDVILQVVSNATGAAVNGTIALSATPDPDTTSAPQVEPMQTFLMGASNNGWLVTTITGCNSAYDITILDNASITSTTANMYYGTDNASIVQSMFSLASDGALPNETADKLTQGRFPGYGGQGEAFDGLRQVVIRGRDRDIDRGRCGVSSALNLVSGLELTFIGKASIAALPNFSGHYVLGTPSDNSVYKAKVNDLSLEGMNFAKRDLWLQTGSDITLTGKPRCVTARTEAYHFGMGDVDRLITVKTPVLWYAGVSNSSGTGLNDPAGVGVFIDQHTTDSQFGMGMGYGYRTGWRDEGGAITGADLHFWTDNSYGSMTKAFDLRSNSSQYGTLYADSPSAAAADPSCAGATTYGVFLRGHTTFKDLHVFLNSGGAPILDQQCIPLFSRYQGGFGVATAGDLYLATDAPGTTGAGGVVQFAKEYAFGNLLAAQYTEIKNVSAASGTVATGALATSEQIGMARNKTTQGPMATSGNTYWPANLVLAGAGTANPGVNVINLFKGQIKEAVSMDRLVSRVSTLFIGGKFQLAMYRLDPFAAGMPVGTLILNTADMSTTVATAVYGNVSQVSPPGWYGFAFQCDNATAQFTSLSSSSGQLMNTFGANNVFGSSSLLTGWTINNPGAYGTWPDLTGQALTEMTTQTVPLIGWRSV